MRESPPGSFVVRGEPSVDLGQWCFFTRCRQMPVAGLSGWLESGFGELVLQYNKLIEDFSHKTLLTRGDLTMLTVHLDDEAEKYLIEILSQEKIPSQELVKKLLRNHLIAIQTPQTILERMGGCPETLLDGAADLSDRDTRKQKISEHLQKKNREGNQ